jgi:hypothetical protein
MSPFLPAGWKLKERKLVRRKFCMGLEFGSETLHYFGGQIKDDIWNNYYEMCCLQLCLDVEGRFQVLIGPVFRS